MSRYALIERGIVATVVEQGDAPTIGGEWVDVTGLHVGPGWAWDGSAWAAPAAQVPAEVTMRQAREALIDAGLIDAVDAAIAAMPEGITKRKALNAWEYSSVVQRHNGLVSQLAPGLGLTEAQIDALFLAAAAIT
jgi:hypothetical protein